ncbi:MAG: Diaminopimelate decarboxylase, partial [uncultured Rubrobacteraceae bacterium]
RRLRLLHGLQLQLPPPPGRGHGQRRPLGRRQGARAQRGPYKGRAGAGVLV